MSTITKRLSVDQYDRMVENGILPETNRFELILGRIVEKEVKNPAHRVATQRTFDAIRQRLPSGWHVSKEDPVRIPKRRSEPEPDVSVVKGSIDDYTDQHPGPTSIVLVVEVTRSSVAKDRKLARFTVELQARRGLLSFSRGERGEPRLRGRAGTAG